VHEVMQVPQLECAEAVNPEQRKIVASERPAERELMKKIYVILEDWVRSRRRCNETKTISPALPCPPAPRFEF